MQISTGICILCCTWGACGAISGQRYRPKQRREIADTSAVLHHDVCGARGLFLYMKWKRAVKISTEIRDDMVHVGRLWGHIGARVETQRTPRNPRYPCCFAIRCMWCERCILLFEIKVSKQISTGICDFTVHVVRLRGPIGARVETQMTPRNPRYSCCFAVRCMWCERRIL